MLIRKYVYSYGKRLNKRLVTLGDFSEGRNYELKYELISIELFDPNDNVHNTVLDADGIKKSECEFIPSYLDRVHYLSCHRIGALDIYEKQHSDSVDCGIEGEFSLGVLLQNDEYSLPLELTIIDGKHVNTLPDQVNYWLKRIIGTTVKSKDIDRTNYLRVLYNNNPKYTLLERFHNRPVNIGSGVSYLISIIITCLMAEADSIICIENPEIHLHPKAQSELIKFLYFVASSGRQIFVETHSDHIFNGIRVGIVKKEMDNEKIAIDFLALNKKTFETQCNPIQINEYGDIQGLNAEMTLDDFFDQFSIDLDAMLGL